jgi:hypothetical protein
MGSLEFTCSCGATAFLNSSDNRSYVGHLIPDQLWDQFWDDIDAAIERRQPSGEENSKTCMSLRMRLARRLVWQCPGCGSLYVEDDQGRRHRFVPASPEVSKRLLSKEGR